jgi:hypothetical protein
MDPASMLDQLLDTIRDPTADPRRTVILIAIGLVVFLVLAVVVFILLPSEKREDKDWTLAEPAPSKAAARHSPILLGISVLLALVVLVGWGYGDHRARQDATCRSCHVLEEVVDSWEAGSHPKVACIDCHSSAGILGFVETRVRGLANALGNLGGEVLLRKPVTVDQGSCRSCHEKALSEVLTAGSLRVRHADFADRLSCSQCHGSVGHDATGTQSRSISAMNSCAECHDGTTASRECATCHVGDIAFVGSGPAEYASVELGSPATCDGCHSLEGCTECHGLEMPHPEGWAEPKAHARSGAFDTELCGRCHDPGCQPCHRQIHTDHPADWKNLHKSADRNTCTQCHNVEKVGTDMCRLCHDSA